MREVDPDWLAKDTGGENFTEAGREEADTLQDARGGGGTE
jgi:hypothetical protein